MTKSVILCGGYGTRIRDVSQDIPKPMIPVGRYPILWHIMKYFSCFGHQDFVLCLGYKSESIKDYFLNYQSRKIDFTMSIASQNIQYHTNNHDEDWTVTFAETGLNAYTGSRVKQIKKYVENDEFFILTYGDGVGNIDVNKLIEFHKSHKKIMTVTGVHPPGRFGELLVNENQVVGFNEKPQVTEGWISGGFFVCNKAIFNYLNDDESLVFEQEPMTQIVKDNQLMVYKHNEFWHPMDTSRDYHLLNNLWEAKKAPWKIW